MGFLYLYVVVDTNYMNGYRTKSLLKKNRYSFIRLLETTLLNLKITLNKQNEIFYFIRSLNKSCFVLLVERALQYTHIKCILCYKATIVTKYILLRVSRTPESMKCLP